MCKKTVLESLQIWLVHGTRYKKSKVGSSPPCKGDRELNMEVNLDESLSQFDNEILYLMMKLFHLDIY
jgi:hypothetical protein